METTPSYDEAYVRDLFDRMGRTYDVVNLLSSFGFNDRWRRQCVELARVGQDQRVCDLMAGGGESWRQVVRRGASLVSIDFSPVMVRRQMRLRDRFGGEIEVRCENATATSLADESVDAVICAFGLKTLGPAAADALAREVNRILRPGGGYAFLEISTAEGWWLGSLYRWYLSAVIPLLGRLCLGDVECYRMLGVYTKAFGSCAKVIDSFRSAGLNPGLRSHFHGCATSLSGVKQA